MKRWLFPILLFSLLLCACGPEQLPETVPTTLPPPTTQPATLPEAQPTEATEASDPLELLLSGMSREELVGQLFLARCPDINAAEDAAQYHLGGYLLFGRDFQGQTPESMMVVIASYQEAAAIPMLIAVDEEGGTVARVSAQPAFRDSRFPSPRSLYETGGLQAVLDIEAEKSRLLTSLGINVNMAPVCDITTDRRAFMYDRSLGQSPEVTGEFVSSAVAIMAEYRLGSVLKHFPGYGNNTDTHTGIATDSRALEALEDGLRPFAAGIEAGCGAVLVSHTIVTCLDDTLPASLSPGVHRCLREEMGFDGVIVTDDLVMQAITDRYGEGEAAVLAVLAGNDLLCVTNYALQYQAVMEAVESGRIPIDTLRAAVRRVLQWKYDLGLLSF